MQITRHDWTMLIYNTAAVLSGGYVVQQVEFTDTGSLLFVSIAFGIVWTIYFKFSILRRFEDHPRFSEDAEA